MNDALKGKLLKLGKANFARHGRLPVLDRHSPGWEAWREFRVANGLPVAFMGSRDAMTFPSEFPPDDIDAALAELPGIGSGRLQRRLAV